MVAFHLRSICLFYDIFDQRNDSAEFMPGAFLFVVPTSALMWILFDQAV